MSWFGKRRSLGRGLALTMGLALGLSLVGAAPLWAADEEGRGAVRLEDIRVKGQGLHRDDLPTTVNIVGAERFEELHGLRIEDILRDVPGVWANNYNQGGVVNQFKMRGYGGGGHGGDVGIFIDGIPLNEGESHADGYADTNVLIPLELDRLEVYKGPSSALFGNFGRGGVLAFYTKRGGEYNTLKFDYGSFATSQMQGAFGHAMSDKVHNNTAFELFQTQGWAENSDWTRMNFSTRFTYDVSDRLDLGFSFRAHESHWNALGYIPKAQFDKGPDYSRLRADGTGDQGGDKKFFTQRFDAGYNISKELRLLYWAYGTQQDFTRYQTSGFGSSATHREYAYDRQVLGTGTSLNLDTKLAGKSLTGVLGAEFYDEITDTQVYNTNKDRGRTSRAQDRIFDIATYSLFAQSEYEVSPYFRPMVGLRYDFFGGSLENRDNPLKKYERDINDFNSFNPKVGFRSKLIDRLDFRASYCEGFALPNSAVKFDPKAQVDPMKLKQYEAGLNYAISKFLTADVAYFILDTENEVQESPAGSGEYANLGKTRRKGVETGLKLFPFKGMELFGTLTLTESEILENADKSLVGKEVTGVPDYTTVLGAQYTHFNGLGGRLTWRHVNSYYADSANLYKDGAYDVVDATIFYTIRGADRRKYKISLSVDNVFDEYYATYAGYGSGTLYYTPGWPRTYWVGLTLDW